MKNWFYKIDEKSNGPITQEELLFSIEHGELREETLIRENDSDEWIKISEVKGLLPLKKSAREKREEQKRRKKLQSINYKLMLKILFPIYAVLITIWYLFFRELDAKVLELLFSFSLFIFGAIKIIFNISYFDMEYSFVKGEYGEWKRKKRATKNEKMFTAIFTTMVLVTFFVVLLQ